MVWTRRAGWWLAGAVGALVLGVGCASVEVEQRNPDGSTWRQKSVVFAPEVELRPNEFTVSSGGVTSDGFPIEVLTPRSGKGPTYFRVVPPGQPALQFRANSPVRRTSPSAVPPATDHPFETPPVECAGFDAYRVHVDLLGDVAELQVRTGSQPWRTLASGPAGLVARAAVQAGIQSAEFVNEFGAWRVTVDARFPLLCTRLDGRVVHVRGIP